MIETTRLTGVLCPVVMPFKADLSVDFTRFKNHCLWLLSHDVGLAIFGTNSEANSLSCGEKIGLLQKLIHNGVPSNRLMPGTGCVALTDSVKLTKMAVGLGCAGVLMLPPFFYKGVSDAGLFRSYAEIIDRVDSHNLRVYLYNIPQLSGIQITENLVEMLIKAYPETVVGLKDSSGDWNYARTMIENYASSGFDVFPASETYLSQAVSIGGKGCISATVNANPGAIAELFNKLRHSGGEEEQARVNTLRKIFEQYPMIAALKATIAYFTNDPGWIRVRPPLEQCTTAQSTSLVNQLIGEGFKMEGLTR